MKAKDISGINLDITNMCTLQCSGCARTRFRESFKKYWKNHNIKKEDLFSFLDINLADTTIQFCGSYGDPIYHEDLISIVQEFKTQGANIRLHTNGSYRDISWWENFTDVLDDKDLVVFSIDGTPENFTTYRKNADWSSIKIGIDAVVRSKAKSRWDYIIFRYNQHDVEYTEQLSNELGIDVFNLKRSERFDDETQWLIPIDNLGWRYQAQQDAKEGLQVPVDPRCKNNKQHYITATGHYLPCCWFDDYRYLYKTQFGDNQSQYDIRNTTISKILALNSVQEFYNTVEQNSICQFNCPSCQSQ